MSEGMRADLPFSEPGKSHSGTSATSLSLARVTRPAHTRVCGRGFQPAQRDKGRSNPEKHTVTLKLFDQGLQLTFPKVPPEEWGPFEASLAGDQTDPPAPAPVLSGLHVLRTNQRGAGCSQSHLLTQLPKARRAALCPGPAAPHRTPRGLGRGCQGRHTARPRRKGLCREEAAGSRASPQTASSGASVRASARHALIQETDTNYKTIFTSNPSTKQILAKQPQQQNSDACARLPLSTSEQAKLAPRADGMSARARERRAGLTRMALKWTRPRSQASEGWRGARLTDKGPPARCGFSANGWCRQGRAGRAHTRRAPTPAGPTRPPDGLRTPRDALDKSADTNKNVNITLDPAAVKKQTEL